MYSVKDVIKKSFLEGFSANDISLKTVVIALVVALIISVYIFVLYRVVCRKTFYSKNFNISLVGVALITTAIILTIQSSVVVSLGMVGALSIVRFRTAVKDPMDLMFMFWSISTGIICGAGLAEYAVVLAVILTVAVILLNVIPDSKAAMILIVNCNRIDAEKEITEAVGKYSSHSCVKARNMAKDSIDMTLEVRTKEEAALLKAVLEVPGVGNASLLKHDGEVTF